MKRLKPYDVPHKGLRNALAQVQLLAGKTDYSNNREVEELYRLGKDVFKILNLHAKDENEVILARLEQRWPGCSKHDLDDHINFIIPNSSWRNYLKEFMKIQRPAGM